MDEIDTYGEHNKTAELPDTDEKIPSRMIGGGSTSEPEQEKSFGETNQRTRIERIVR